MSSAVKAFVFTRMQSETKISPEDRTGLKGQRSRRQLRLVTYVARMVNRGNRNGPWDSGQYAVQRRRWELNNDCDDCVERSTSWCFRCVVPRIVYRLYAQWQRHAGRRQPVITNKVPHQICEMRRTKFKSRRESAHTRISANWKRRMLHRRAHTAQSCAWLKSGDKDEAQRQWRHSMLELKSVRSMDKGR